MSRQRTPRTVHSQTARDYEVELIPGLERFVDDELAVKLGRQGYRSAEYPRDGRMSIKYAGPVRPLLSLRSAIGVHLVERFDVPRPKALLGHKHLTRLLVAIGDIVSLRSPGTFETFRLSAAGADSSTFRRLRSEIGAALALEDQPDEGHLQLAVRRPPSGPGWEVLIRLTPMPLSARVWRVCNRPDALNATIAHAMITLAGPRAGERFLNLGCGSGTLLIERMASGPVASIVGVDVEPDALACATRNLDAASMRTEVDLVRAHIQELPLPSESFDTVVADLPFGMVRGTDANLDRLYAGALSEAARLVVPGGTFVVFTARRRLFEDTLERFTDRWERTAEVPLSVSFPRGYIKPSIYLLRRV